MASQNITVTDEMLQRLQNPTYLHIQPALDEAVKWSLEFLEKGDSWEFNHASAIIRPDGPLSDLFPRMYNGGPAKINEVVWDNHMRILAMCLYFIDQPGGLTLPVLFPFKGRPKKGGPAQVILAKLTPNTQKLPRKSEFCLWCCGWADVWDPMLHPKCITVQP